MKFYRLLKRILDVLFSILGLAVLSPILCGIAVAIRLDSPGKVLFRQSRIGKGCKPFVIFKFRSMYAHTPDNLPTHLMSLPDTYITRVGRFLRKTSLDELPQMINIMRGEMSFVGPRPALWNQEDLIEERQKYGANDVRPGLTGWAQVNGRDELPVAQKARLDGEYITKASLRFDALCIWKTIGCVLRSDGIAEGGKRIRVLLTDGFARQALPMGKALKELGCKVYVLCQSRLDVAYASRYPDAKILMHHAQDDPRAFLDQILEIVKRERIDLIIPLTDFSATVLSQNKATLMEWTRVAVNDEPVFNLAIDKQKTMELCMRNAIPCPRTLVEPTQQLTYPLAIKPRSACGSIGFCKVDRKENLFPILERYPPDLGPLLIQEYIPQNDTQYNVHVFIDKNHEVKCAVVCVKSRWFPIDGGASTFSYTQRNQAIGDLCVSLLRRIGWNGYADLDVIVDPRDHTPKIIEVNPRISANIKLCFQAGVNVARLILENEFKDTVTSYPEYLYDRRMRCFHTELLWFIKSPDRFSSKPSWFSLRRTCDQIFSLTDPWPWFTFTLQSFTRYRSEMKKRGRVSA